MQCVEPARKFMVTLDEPFPTDRKHHHFEIDREGKDSDRFRQAGAVPVLIADLVKATLISICAGRLDIAGTTFDADVLIIEGLKELPTPKLLMIETRRIIGKTTKNEERIGKAPRMTDHFGRIIDYARIAVMSACNLRCAYGLRDESEAHKKTRQLNVEDTSRMITLFGEIGVRIIRFTGQEPLLHPAIAKTTHGTETVKITTNGVLIDAGLKMASTSASTPSTARGSSRSRSATS